MPDRIGTGAAARIAGVCAKTMRNYAERGIVPGAVQYETGTWRFDEARLKRWIRERETQGWRAETSSSATASGTHGARCEAGMYDAAYEQLLSPRPKSG